MIRLPVITRNKDVEIKSVNGQSVFDLREQILTILDRDLNSDLVRNFFAEPVVNEVKGEVSWYTPLQGQVRTFQDLSSEERHRVSDAIRSIDDQLKSAANKIAKAGPRAGWLGDAIRAMLFVPDLENSMFIVGGAPVLAQWGCVPFGSDPADYEIIVQDIEKKKPINKAVAADAAAAFATEAAAVEPPPSEPEFFKEDEPVIPPEPVIAPETPAVRSDWRRYFPGIWSLLLLLLLILGLLLNYYYRPPVIASSIDIARGDIDVLWGKISERANQCVAGTAPLPVDVNGISVPEVERQLDGSGVQISQTLNISLAWKAPADLDLAVKEPNNAVINFSHPTSPSSGHLDVDANRVMNSTQCALDPSRDPIENISWTQSPPSGTYRVDVLLYNLCAVTDPNSRIAFKLLIKKHGGQTQEIPGEVSRANPIFTYNLSYN